MRFPRAAMLDTHLRSLGTNELFWSAAGLLWAQRVTVDFGFRRHVRMFSALVQLASCVSLIFSAKVMHQRNRIGSTTL